jgi:hypothetical protein
MKRIVLAAVLLIATLVSPASAATFSGIPCDANVTDPMWLCAKVTTLGYWNTGIGAGEACKRQLDTDCAGWLPLTCTYGISVAGYIYSVKTLTDVRCVAASDGGFRCNQWQATCQGNCAVRCRERIYAPPREEDEGPPVNCPLVVDLGQPGFDFTSAAEGVRFDIDADGIAEELAWTSGSGGDGFLVFDRDGNGNIDSGLELFGNVAAQHASADPNGYRALSVLDQAGNGGNEDGLVSASDALFSRLRIWIDASHDGISQSNELHELTALGIEAFSLDYKESRRRDAFGNELRYRSTVILSGQGRDTKSIDVFFAGR